LQAGRRFAYTEFVRAGTEKISMSVGSKAGLAAGVTSVSRAVSASAVSAERARLPLIDALRALAASLIAWHHFCLYPPLADGAMSFCGVSIDWVRDHARAAQVFFVVSGYILAKSMSRRYWDGRAVGRFVIHRYCRLGLPYLGAIIAALAAWAMAHNWLDASVIGPPATWHQLLAHLFFLHDILGYDSVSAGLWFVCISMQLSLIFVAGLCLRDVIAGRSGNRVRNALSNLPMILGWLLAGASLFYFNRDDRWDMWAWYFFGQFFLGVVVYAALQKPRSQVWLGLYVLMMIAAIAYDWRGRLLTTLATGLILYAGGRYGFMSTWPKSRVVSFMGRTSYSLFLIHYPVMIVVATLWAMWNWTAPELAALGLVVAYFLSVAAAAVFYRMVESPAAKLSHRFS
jgi:peptidoglycan/LPS O-acetylase OafA/YrhL